VKAWVLSAAQVPRSSYKFKKTEDDQRKNNKGRPVPGFTTNRDGSLVLDVSILEIINRYRLRPEYANAGGVRKLKHLMRRDYGIYINEKKIYRICRENKVLLSRRRSRGIAERRLAINRSVTKPNQVWQFDLKYGYVDGEGKFFFVLAFIDVVTRKVVGEHIGLNCKSGDLCFALRQALVKEGILPEHPLVIRSDNGPQMTSREFSKWLSKLENKLHHEFIPLQTPNKNAHIESFFSILELEFLQIRYFRSFAEAYEETKKFIRFYNEERIHGSIGYITPTEAMEKHQRGELLNIKTINM
jgi:putative transposase